MKTIAWNNVRFIKSATKPEEYPTICNSLGTKVLQVAVTGRSNVGKSSLLNSLFSHKGMVKVSQTPGKTQLINFFCVDDALFCVDLPGYGFAKCPLSVKKAWNEMMKAYFMAKESAPLLLCLFDSRRTPNEDDIQLLEWARFYNKAYRVVVTKVDKLKKSEMEKQSRLIAKHLQVDVREILLHSSQTHEGRDALRRTIETTLLRGGTLWHT
jgi:GTP-binding protein